MRAKRFIVGNSYEGTGEVKGILFTVLKRERDKCIFSRSDGYYEVGCVKYAEIQNTLIAGKQITFGGGEHYPNGDNWNGKCVKSLERAEELFGYLK